MKENIIFNVEIIDIILKNDNRNRQTIGNPFSNQSEVTKIQKEKQHLGDFANNLNGLLPN